MYLRYKSNLSLITCKNCAFCFDLYVGAYSVTVQFANNSLTVYLTPKNLTYFRFYFITLFRVLRHHKPAKYVLLIFRSTLAIRRRFVLRLVSKNLEF